MLTTRRFNRRRAAEIRAKHQAVLRERALQVEVSRLRQRVIGFDPSTQIQPGETFEQAWARFQAEKIRTAAALEQFSRDEPRATKVAAKGWRACLARIKGALWP